MHPHSPDSPPLLPLVKLPSELLRDPLEAELLAAGRLDLTQN